jgi:hypothetical protein
MLAIVFAVNATDSLQAQVTLNPGVAATTSPSDVRIIDLTDNSVTANDTLAADEYNLYGPIAITYGGGYPMCKGLKIFARPAAVASGDSLQVQYQFLRGTSINDTVTGNYTSMDTIVNGGATGTYVDVSSEVGNSLMLRFKALSSTAVISDIISIGMKMNATYNR